MNLQVWINNVDEERQLPAAEFKCTGEQTLITQRRLDTHYRSNDFLEMNTDSPTILSDISTKSSEVRNYN